MTAQGTTRGAAALITLGLLGACSTGAVPDTGAPSTDDTASPGHPLVPSEYKWYWNTAGCDTPAGDPGVQVYWLAEGSASASGDLAMTETWYWLFGDDGYEGDCFDTFTLEGSLEPDADFIELGCADCDRAYRVVRTLTDRAGEASRCDERSYHRRFGLADPPAVEAYHGYVLLDVVNGSGDANAHDEMVVVQANERSPGFYVIDPVFAAGHARPGASAGSLDYDWLGDACVPR